MSGPTASIGLYLKVWAALLVLTAVTVGAAYLDLGPLNPIVAMSVATGKMLLVAVFFMHLRYHPRLNWLFAGAGLLWLLILIGLTLSDILSRGWVGDETEFLL